MGKASALFAKVIPHERDPYITFDNMAPIEPTGEDNAVVKDTRPWHTFAAWEGSEIVMAESGRVFAIYTRTFQDRFRRMTDAVPT